MNPPTACTCLPAAYDRFTGERQVQEASSDFKGERVLQGMAIDDEGHVILLAQQIAKVSAVLCNGCPCCLKQELWGRGHVIMCSVHQKTELKKKIQSSLK